MNITLKLIIILYHNLPRYQSNLLSPADDRDLNGHLEEDMKRARTQYEGGHPGYPGPGAGAGAGMWAGRWAAASPGIKTEAEKPGAGGGPQHGASTELGGSPHHHPPAPAPSSYPATFHEGQIVSVQPATTAADILYDSINISQANIYPALSSSLGKHCSHACISPGRCPLSRVSVLPRSHPAAAPRRAKFPC